TVAPLAVQLPVPAVHADLAEAGTLAQRSAGRVFREHPRDELPETALLAGGDQPLQRQPAHPAPPGGAIDVDRELAHPGVARTGPVGADAGPGHHLAVVLDDDRGVPLAALVQQMLDLRGAARLCLERCLPLLDALIVDPGDRRRVLPARQPERGLASADHRLVTPPLRPAPLAG